MNTGNLGLMGACLQWFVNTFGSLPAIFIPVYFKPE
jgi:hypothetical protein